MPEQHNIEYKTSWHDDYLKTICAFANSQGGFFFINKKINKIATYSNYNELRQADISGKLLFDPVNNLIYTFGKHSGKLVTDHLIYAEWIISADFPEDTKNLLRKLRPNKWLYFFNLTFSFYLL